MNTFENNMFSSIIFLSLLDHVIIKGAWEHPGFTRSDHTNKFRNSGGLTHATTGHFMRKQSHKFVCNPPRFVCKVDCMMVLSLFEKLLPNQDGVIIIWKTSLEPKTHQKPYHMVLLLPIAPLLIVWHNSKVLNRQPATLFLLTQNQCHNAKCNLQVTCKPMGSGRQVTLMLEDLIRIKMENHRHPTNRTWIAGVWGDHWLSNILP